MNTLINNDWDILIKEEIQKEYFVKLANFIDNEYKNKTIFPDKKNIFKALYLTNFKDVKVVILGQDPYHGVGEAQGLAFSIQNNFKITPSLRNIFKELENDLNIKRNNTDLTDWARQGVLLLNSILTVEKDKPLSHKNIGWENFTNEIITKLSLKGNKIVFVLWGSSARSKKTLIDDKKHFIIESVHPSPLSANRGFLGSKPFSKINKYLEDNKKEQIRW